MLGVISPEGNQLYTSALLAINVAAVPAQIV
jgi:hypothetical protein